MIKCSQEKCNEDAVVTYCWPGHPERLFACLYHYMAADGVSKITGQLSDVRFITIEDIERVAKEATR